MNIKFLGIFTVGLVFIETLSYFLIKDTKTERILKILNRDNKLFWIQRSNINTFFEGVLVTTNSYGFREREIGKKDKKRILIMGASPAFGWGIEKSKRYSDVLQSLLEDKYEVINASIIGYSSYQGKLLIVDLMDKLSPDIVIFDYGINDPDRYRFFINNGKRDSQIKLNFFYKYLYVPYCVKLLAHVIMELNLFPNYINFTPRVTPVEFKDNLLYFHQLSRLYGFKLIVLTTPFFYPDKCDDYKDIREEKLTDKDYIKKIIDKGIDLNKRIYEIQLCKVLDDVQKLNSIKRMLKKDIIVIDIATIFHKKQEMFLNSEFDFVHLSEKGHYIIAEKIKNFIN